MKDKNKKTIERLLRFIKGFDWRVCGMWLCVIFMNTLISMQRKIANLEYTTTVLTDAYLTLLQSNNSLLESRNSSLCMWVEFIEHGPDFADFVSCIIN